jgi:CheY-like chemotaxis protein
MSGEILVVDDNTKIRDVIKESLNFMGYSVSLASNGLEALHILEEEPKPHLILLDLMMPVMDGWEFRMRQQQDPQISQIPTVVITADGNSTLNAKLMGAERGISKPFEMEELLEVVAKYCGHN